MNDHAVGEGSNEIEKTESRSRRVDDRIHLAAALAAIALLLLASAANAALHWGNKGHKCEGPNRIEYARLWGLAPGSNWKKICEKTKARGISKLSDTKIPSYCVDKGGLGTWGEWKYSNHASCGAQFARTKQAGCFGPNRQVYSARLEGNLHGRSWESACASTNGPNNLGKPDRCVKDALSTGIWGEWYSNQACVKPLQWGTWKDNGCVRDMKRPDANAGGISLDGMRSYSAVLWNVGGDWMEACRHTPIQKRMPNGTVVNAPYPTACAVADANDALSWTAAAILGAGTAFIPTPDPASKAALAGAAIGLGSKAAEELLLNSIDSSLNVWGIVWVEDASCGVLATADASSDSNPGATGNEGVAATRYLDICPADATGLSGQNTCRCTADQASSGRVWGTDTYTEDSSICAAAQHAGIIGAQGGQVILRRTAGLQHYVGSTRNGIGSAHYGPWRGSFEFTGSPAVQ